MNFSFKKMMGATVLVIFIFLVGLFAWNDWEKPMNIIQPNGAVLRGEGEGKPIFEFPAPTHKWFEGYKGLYNSMAAGDHPPGDEVKISLENGQHLMNLENKQLRFKLTERRKDGSYLRTVDEKTLRAITNTHVPEYSINLPDSEGVLYFISAQLLNHGRVEDTILSEINVPVQEVKAEMLLECATFSSGEIMHYTINNLGQSRLSFGEFYSLEKYEQGVWKEVLQDRLVIAIGYSLEVGGTWSGELDLHQLQHGMFRFNKSVEGSGTPIKKNLSAEFTIN